MDYLYLTSHNLALDSIPWQVSYVLDTEDVMVRRQRHAIPPSPPWRHARQARFLAWLETATARLKAEKDTAEELAQGLVAAAATAQA